MSHTGHGFESSASTMTRSTADGCTRMSLESSFDDICKHVTRRGSLGGTARCTVYTALPMSFVSEAAALNGKMMHIAVVSGEWQAVSEVLRCITLASACCLVGLPRDSEVSWGKQLPVIGICERVEII